VNAHALHDAIHHPLRVRIVGRDSSRERGLQRKNLRGRDVGPDQVHVIGSCHAGNENRVVGRTAAWPRGHLDDTRRHVVVAQFIDQVVVVVARERIVGHEYHHECVVVDESLGPVPEAEW
jgi:hypothetical protein